MKHQERIKTAVERSVKAMTLRPTIARGTAVTRVRARQGLTCEIEDGRWTLTADMPAKVGGEASGPDPGVFGRSALGSCLAVGYLMWAARREVPVDSLEVEIQADYDARGEYGVGDVRPGYEEIRYIVTVESEAPEAEIREWLDEAEPHIPYLEVFRRPQNLRRELRINPSRASDDATERIPPKRRA